MITNFEYHTRPLDQFEMEVVAKCVKHLKSYAIGKNNSVTAKELSLVFNLSESRIRKVIHYIRTKGLIGQLVATQSGYYITNDLATLIKYERSLLERISSIDQVRKTIADQINNLLYEHEWSAEKNTTK